MRPSCAIQAIQKQNMDQDLDERERTLLATFGDDIDPSDLPKSLIVTNLEIRIFSPGELKTLFEGLFSQYDDNVTFQYFKSFRRAKVNFQTPSNAAVARIHCHERKVGDATINCYFSQSLGNANENKDTSHLHPPALTKQFLISPPASPPVGWEPINEGEPIINYELLAALSLLTPGEAHQLHPPSDKHPAIVVHICEDMKDEFGLPIKSKIMQTARPPTK